MDPKLFKHAQNKWQGGVRQSPYIHLLAVSTKYFKEQLVNIYVSTKRGYIFVQTDKPIYTPGETGKIDDCVLFSFGVMLNQL